MGVGLGLDTPCFRWGIAGALWSNLGPGSFARPTDERDKITTHGTDNEVPQLLRIYSFRGNQVRILWNLRVITGQEGRNHHVSRETLTAS